MVENRNWSLYNKMLEDRGDITVYISDALLKNIDDVTRINKEKVGRPFSFGNLIILGAYCIKCISHFGYREVRGLIKGISDKLKYNLIPNFRTIWWRINRIKNSDIKLEMRERLEKGKLIVSIDSTGIKQVNDNEYRTFKYRKIKDWLKLHLVVDSLGRIKNARVTKNNVSDSQIFKRLISPIKEEISLIRGDGAYDTNEIFKFCKESKINCNIPVRINATKDHRHKERREEILKQLGMVSVRGNKDSFMKYNKEYRRNKRDEWKKRTAYGRRWIVESTFASFKRIYGEYVFSRKHNMVEKEIAMKVLIFNKMK